MTCRVILSCFKVHPLLFKAFTLHPSKLVNLPFTSESYMFFLPFHHSIPPCPNILGTHLSIPSGKSTFTSSLLIHSFLILYPSVATTYTPHKLWVTTPNLLFLWHSNPKCLPNTVSTTILFYKLLFTPRYQTLHILSLSLHSHLPQSLAYNHF